MSLAGKRILVSAGPTLEDIDPVRFLGNRSSGKMGFAIAGEAARRGAVVQLVAGPVSLTTPAGVSRQDVRSAAQMHAAVMAALPADIYIGAAAVADFTPQQVAAQKLKKTPDSTHMTLTLVRTRDILADVAAARLRPACVVGFAAETDDIERYAQGKLAAKGVDMICANQVGRVEGGFESEQNALTVYWPGGSVALAMATKTEIAAQLLNLLESRF